MNQYNPEKRKNWRIFASELRNMREKKIMLKGEIFILIFRENLFKNLNYILDYLKFIT